MKARLGILLLASLTAPAVAFGGTVEPLRFVDDRGEAIQADLEVCFRIGTHNECVTSPAGAPVRIPPEAEAVRVEGADHGPATANRREIEERGRLAVARKARLDVAAPSNEKISVSLYSQDDPSFRSPLCQGEVQGGSSLKVPAGKHLVSLGTNGRAPDLHLLKAEPGGRHRLSYTPRSGWSLVLRCLDNEDGRPVAKAAVKVQGVEGFSAPGVKAMRGVSVAGGLALFSGIPHVLGSAIVEHPRFVANHQEGLSASPGTFAFREARLSRGATLLAKVTVSGRATEGVGCEVLAFDPNPIGPLGEPEILFEGKTSKEGVCRSGQLAAGPYTLRLKVSESRSQVDRSVVLADGQETEMEVPLVPIRVHGKVVRGTEPAPSYAVIFYDMDEIKPNQTRRDAQAEAITDEEGEYKAVLWVPSEYAVALDTPKKVPAAHKRVRLEGEEERVDFSLEKYDVAGVVIDERDRPVQDARVMISWQRLSRQARTDENGAFSFPLTELGQGRIEAVKMGYVSPGPVEVVVQPDSPPPPVVVRLRRAGLLAGRVFVGGAAAAGANVSSYRLEPGGSMTFLGSTLADGEGRFQIAAEERGATRLFVTGAGCPLTRLDTQPSTEETIVRCPELPASVALYFQDTKGHPVAGRAVLARHEGGVIPAEVLRDHLSHLRLPAATDGSGRLLLVGLAPGNYDFFLAEATFPELIAQGAPQGFLTSASLAPLTTSEFQVTIETSQEEGRRSP